MVLFWRTIIFSSRTNPARLRFRLWSMARVMVSLWFKVAIMVLFMVSFYGSDYGLYLHYGWNCGWWPRELNSELKHCGRTIMHYYFKGTACNATLAYCIRLITRLCNTYMHSLNCWQNHSSMVWDRGIVNASSVSCAMMRMRCWWRRMPFLCHQAHVVNNHPKYRMNTLIESVAVVEFLKRNVWKGRNCEVLLPAVISISNYKRRTFCWWPVFQHYVILEFPS